MALQQRDGNSPTKAIPNAKKGRTDDKENIILNHSNATASSPDSFHDCVADTDVSNADIMRFLKSSVATKSDLQLLSQKVGQTEATTQKLQKQVESMEERVRALESKKDLDHSAAFRAASAPPSGQPIAQRNPAAFDPTIVRLSTANIIGRDALAHKLQIFVTEANLDAIDFDLLPKTTEAKGYRMQFKGNSATAKAKQFIESLRTDSGWKDLSVDRPSGGQEKVFIGADRSKNDADKNRNLKTIHDLIAAHASHLPLVKLPREAVITSNWKPIVKLQLADQYKVPHWQNAAKELGLDTESIESAFKERISAFRS